MFSLRRHFILHYYHALKPHIITPLLLRRHFAIRLLACRCRRHIYYYSTAIYCHYYYIHWHYYYHTLPLSPLFLHYLVFCLFSSSFNFHFTPFFIAITLLACSLQHTYIGLPRHITLRHYTLIHTFWLLVFAILKHICYIGYVIFSTLAITIAIVLLHIFIVGRKRPLNIILLLYHHHLHILAVTHTHCHYRVIRIGAAHATPNININIVATGYFSTPRLLR